MIEFKVSDIPIGESEETLYLDKDELDLGSYEFSGGKLYLHFNREDDTIRIFFTIETDLTLICDRSLEPFTFSVDEDYEVIYRLDGEEFSDDVEVTVKPLASHQNVIQIDQEVRDTILLAIPAKKLHPKFLDENGEPTDFQATYGEETTDSRWEPLKSLKKNSQK